MQSLIRLVQTWTAYVVVIKISAPEQMIDCTQNNASSFEILRRRIKTPEADSNSIMKTEY